MTGLYTNNGSLPLGQQDGLRQMYKFGLYSHCGYINSTFGVCSNSTAASRFTPYDVLTADMLANYTRISNALFVSTTFTNSSYLGNFTHGAYYLLIIGTVCAVLALFMFVAPGSSMNRRIELIPWSTVVLQNIPLRSCCRRFSRFSEASCF